MNILMSLERIVKGIYNTHLLNLSDSLKGIIKGHEGLILCIVSEGLSHIGFE